VFILFDSNDRAIAQKAIELTDKKVDAVITALGELSLASLDAVLLQGFIGKVRRDVFNTERDGFDWNGDIASTACICIDVYRGKLESLRESQLKLVVPTHDTDEKLTGLSFLRDKIVGQGAMRFRSAVVEAEARMNELLKEDDASASLSVNGGPEVPFTKENVERVLVPVFEKALRRSGRDAAARNDD
jgi:hypothetical protein